MQIPGLAGWDVGQTSQQSGLFCLSIGGTRLLHVATEAQVWDNLTVNHWSVHLGNLGRKKVVKEYVHFVLPILGIHGDPSLLPTPLCLILGRISGMSSR